MAVTRSWETRVALELEARKPPVPPERRRELWWLLAASLLVAGALALVYSAKARDFDEARTNLAAGSLLNLNTLANPAALVPFLEVMPAAEREAAANATFEFVERSRPLANVGALARLKDPKLPLGRLKSLMIVRTPSEHLREFLIWSAIYFAAFHGVHLVWRFRRLRTDAAILPALHLLTGIGLAMALSIRDPLRDTLEFRKFAWGVAAGCLFLLLPVFRAFSHRIYARWVYTPLLAAFALFLALLRFGTGPTGSDAKVNLGPFQPVELIKILLVLFLAGYFARRWEWLRELRDRRLRWINIPRMSHTLPVMCGVAFSLVMFFVLHDMGPALVTGFVFLILFSVARGRVGLAFIGIAILVGGFALGYRAGKPRTVADRITMWLAPWDNDVRGGDQLAHSLWAFSTGGPLGSGPGLGDPGMIPAGHTDLVLSAVGEEWGFAGVATVGLLFAFLFWRAIRAALSAPDEYALFLALGLSTLVGIEMLLISGGALGVIPLSGVVSPFLSSGNTAMLANFLIFGLILGVSNQRRNAQRHPEAMTVFAGPVRWLGVAMGVAAFGLLARAATIQMIQDDDLLARDTRVLQDDGVKRAQHNPRLNSLAREVTRGSVYDRNGVLLATSRWDEYQQHRNELAALEPDSEPCCRRLDNRHYPFGRATAHLLGDFRTRENFQASNTSLIEHDQNARLQGFASFKELAPLVRYRHRDGNAAIKALKARDRSVRTTIDIRLQLKAAEILERRLRQGGKEKGALAIVDAATGDVLALASAPAPRQRARATPDELLDRARYGQYPPGSTFKLVTAIAALRIDPALARKTFHCAPLPGGRVGTVVPGWRRPIRDDIGDPAHGRVDMMKGITVSCNAYFAQLGAISVGAKALKETSELAGFTPGSLEEVQQYLPFAAYGQGTIVATPFKMARVSAAIANGGSLPQGRWVSDESNPRRDQPLAIVNEAGAHLIAEAMRAVVKGGTGRRAMAGLDVSVAGKTGTAQVDEGLPHSWFTGFAPYDTTARRIAFAVVVEHGGYGSQAAAPIARELIEAARDLGIIQRDERVK